MIRDSFIFYKSFRDALQEVSEDVRLQIYDAIVDYSLGITDKIEFRGIAKIAWLLIKPQLDANIKRYKNGSKGGAPKGNKNARKTTEKQPKNNQRLNEKTTEKQPNKNVNVNVNENEKENEKEKSVCKKEKIHTHTQPDIFSNPENHEQQLIQSMLNAPMWQEDVCRCYKITQTQLQEHIEQFSAECRAKQTTHQNDRDIRSHFVDWLRYQLNKNQNGRKTTETNPRADYQATLANAIANFANGDT